MAVATAAAVLSAPFMASAAAQAAPVESAATWGDHSVYLWQCVNGGGVAGGNYSDGNWYCQNGTEWGAIVVPDPANPAGPYCLAGTRFKVTIGYLGFVTYTCVPA
ncbi:hypothetical protein L083_4985 [Actinoplanes sp. N902-109]|nr:hypothetical protein L083_4985 [Actinoplanes sp. N902-109]